MPNLNDVIAQALIKSIGGRAQRGQAGDLSGLPGGAALLGSLIGQQVGQGPTPTGVGGSLGQAMGPYAKGAEKQLKELGAMHVAEAAQSGVPGPEIERMFMTTYGGKPIVGSGPEIGKPAEGGTPTPTPTSQSPQPGMGMGQPQAPMQGGMGDGGPELVKTLLTALGGGLLGFFEGGQEALGIVPEEKTARMDQRKLDQTLQYEIGKAEKVPVTQAQKLQAATAVESARLRNQGKETPGQKRLRTHEEATKDLLTVINAFDRVAHGPVKGRASGVYEAFTGGSEEASEFETGANSLLNSLAQYVSDQGGRSISDAELERLSKSYEFKRSMRDKDFRGKLQGIINAMNNRLPEGAQKLPNARELYERVKAERTRQGTKTNESMTQAAPKSGKLSTGMTYTWQG